MLEHDSETMYTFVASLRLAVPMADPAGRRWKYLVGGSASCSYSVYDIILILSAQTVYYPANAAGTPFPRKWGGRGVGGS